MNMDFTKLLDASKGVDLQSAFKEDKKSDYKDERYFKLRHKKNQGRATVRFMPHLDGKMPFVSFRHRFISTPDKKKFFINRCLTSIGQSDPAAEFYQACWDKFNATNDEKWKKLAQRIGKGRDRYIALIHVEQDAQDTPDETLAGMNYLYEYGPEIQKILSNSQKTEDDHGDPITPVNPFSVAADGASFGLLIKPSEEDNGFGTYSASKFKNHGAMFGGDTDALQNMFEMNKDRFWDIHEEVNPKGGKFKTYKEIQTDLINFFGDDYTNLMDIDVETYNNMSNNPNSVGGFNISDDEEPKEEPKEEAKSAPKEDLDDEIPNFESKEEPKEEPKEEVKKEESSGDNEFEDFFTKP